jgi:(2R)-3-sulfolactate dehydrogenase (NADP+)
MSDSVRLGLDAAAALATEALVANGVLRSNAASTARALVAAEADGQAAHGLSRVASYALHARCGKVDGAAIPRCDEVAAGALRIDAALGFAYPALDLAQTHLPRLARHAGIAVAAIYRSHHFGQAGAHAERLADAGLVAMVFGNAPKAMSLPGGRRPMLGTNPMAFAAPSATPGAAALVVDLALSVAARGKIVAAERAGNAIPEGWALDRDGQPTTDPSAALAGTLSPIGGPKGAALALFVEVLAAALTGGRFGWEASSFFDAEGGPPAMGHLIIALDPGRVSGGAYDERIATLFAVVAGESGARLPGARRLENRARAARDGLAISAALHSELVQLAARAPGYRPP